MEFKFEVGGSEKRRVCFQYRSRLAAALSIEVDGTVVAEEKFRVYIPSFRLYEFQVEAEKVYSVAVGVSFARFGRGFIDPSCEVTVDGNLIGKYLPRRQLCQ
jgi:hypothetical protein